MIAVVLVSASRNGLASSQLAPIPLNSSNGGPLPSPCLIATCSNWPSTVTCAVSIAPGFPATTGPALSLLVRFSLKDVGSRSRTKGRIARAAERRRRRHLIAGARVHPVAPIEPPASLALL